MRDLTNAGQRLSRRFGFVDSHVGVERAVVSPSGARHAHRTEE